MLSWQSWHRAGDTVLMLYALVPVVVGALSLALLRMRLPSLGGTERMLSTRWAVLAVGLISALTFCHEWGSLRQLPLVHD